MSILEFKLDVYSSVPVYQQIADHIRHLVAARVLLPGDRLPTLRDLAMTLGVHQNTVSRAFHYLEQERVIASRRGTGAIVTVDSDDPISGDEVPASHYPGDVRVLRGKRERNEGL